MIRRSTGRNLAVSLAAACILYAMGNMTWEVAGSIPTDQVRPVAGMSYAWELPRRALGLIVLSSDSNEEPTRSQLTLHEDGIQLPGAHSPHQTIAELGSGLYSHWGRTIIFSASDGSDPRSNGRRYSYTAQASGNGVFLGLGWGLLALFIVKTSCGFLSSHRREAKRFLLPLGLAAGGMVVAVLGIELVCRLVLPPHCESVWPSRHNPRVGFTFEPGAQVRWGGVKGMPQEFCVSEQANSLGLLDREHAREKPAGTLRVVYLGDSFLEAAQVRMEDKFHVLLEERLAAELGRPVESIALGYSGMGTANLLAFWEEWGAGYSPDLVVLLVVNNDLKNNMPDLECAGNGWDPSHPPRLFFRFDGSGQLVRIPIDPQWQSHATPRSSHRGTAQRLDDFLGRYSAAYAFIVPRLRMQPWARGLLIRLGLLTPESAPQSLEEIKLQDYFNHLAPPPWAEEALRLQGALLARFRDAVGASGARLLVVYVPSVPEATRLGEEYQVGGISGRFGLRGQRVGHEAAAVGLPYLDLGETFHARPGPDRVSFRYDPHWSPQGHAWAAEDIAGFILREGLIAPLGEKQ